MYKFDANRLNRFGDIRKEQFESDKRTTAVRNAVGPVLIRHYRCKVIVSRVAQWVKHAI